MILGGVDTTRFSPGGEPGDGVLFVGRILPHKGIHDLVDARRHRMCRSASSASRWTKTYLDDAARARAHGKQVTFVHDADDAALVEEYRRAACVVLPSVYTTPDGRTTQNPRASRPDAARGDGVRPAGDLHRRRQHARGRRQRRKRVVVPPGDPGALRQAIDSASIGSGRCRGHGPGRTPARARAVPVGTGGRSLPRSLCGCLTRASFPRWCCASPQRQPG